MTCSMDLEARYCASNYYPLPVVRVAGEGKAGIDWAVSQVSAALVDPDTLRLAS